MYPPRSRSSRSLVGSAFAVVALVAGLAACSSASGKAADTTLAPTTTAKSTTTTEESTTTTEAATTTSTTVEETTTTAPAKPIYPLTGVENPDPAIAARPALIVKVDNVPAARPQSGFNEADLVYEEIINDSYTRFGMVFQSGDADPVGPIRSGRLQDVDIFTSLDHPLFAWSGGNRTVTDAINASELVNISHPSHPALYYRSSAKKAPNNLYSSTPTLYSQIQPYQPAAKQQFAYREPGAPAAGTPSAGVGVALDNIKVNWEWHADDGLYHRVMGGKPHMDALSGPVTTNNVVVLAMEYAPGISGSPDAQTLGGGEAFVFTGGNYIHGTWTRADIHDPFGLRADDGTVIALQPGRTFIELPRIGSTLPLPA
jgi:Protein of unknown function (DUF3048) N-terminal domain/Protein of unknown function (DUF3048) C-terminal domain